MRRDAACYDLVVIGGGPAGSVLANLVAGAGHSVLLLERESGPRYRVGESLLPATICDLAPLLGADAALEAADFVLKRGATFSWGDRPDEPWRLAFGPGEAAARTALNVDRASFDAILLDAAAKKGAEVRRGATVLDVGAPRPDGTRAVRVREGNHTRAVSARFTANASGQMRLGVAELDPRYHSRFFRKVAVWGYWRDAARLDPPHDGDVYFEAIRTKAGDAWAWFIPLRHGLTSVGIVAPREWIAEIRRDPRAALEAHVGACPRVSHLLSDAPRASEAPYDEVRVCADYSYASEKFWAPGVFSVGDAACFVDVLLSSGVHLATYGSLLAARSVNAVLDGEIPEALAMNEYESRLRQEFAVFYAGLTGLYDMSQPREHYARWLRDLLRMSNGVHLGWQESPSQPGGLNAALAPPSAQACPAGRAAGNVETMRRFNVNQLLYDGPAEALGSEHLPALRNTLAAAPGAVRWHPPVKQLSMIT